MQARTFATRSPIDNLGRAITLIDSGRADSMQEAKHILERLIQQDASFERACIELARVR
jgi:hypothetical protein